MKTFIRTVIVNALFTIACSNNALAGTGNSLNNVWQMPACSLTVAIISQTNVSCNGGNNGSATANASGGSGTYTYSWKTTPPQTGATANNLIAGKYTVIVTDPVSGCIDSASVTIMQPAALVIKDSIVDITCNGANNGKAVAHVSGGIKPYVYKWSNGSTDSTAINLTPGNDTIRIKDANGCKDSATIKITQPAKLTSSATSTSAECGKSNGKAVDTASGGTRPYSYSWSPSGGTKDTAFNLAAGTYTCTVTDSNGCITGAVVSVSGSAPPTETITTTADSGGCTGTATAKASGGTAPYTYLWNAGQTSSSISSQCSGTYCCKITDSKGCIDSVCSIITGIHEISASADEIEIYPVPARGTLSVNIINKEFIAKYIEIIDMTGRLLSKEDIKAAGRFQIDISSMSTGVYLLKIVGANNITEVRRFVIGS